MNKTPEPNQTFEIIHVAADSAEEVEYLGSKEKFWYWNASLGRCLFKVARPGTGEDWSEKIAEQLALQLGLPCARYELAVSDDRDGVVTPTIVPEGASLKLGNELLVASVSNYPQPGTVSKFRTSQHTIEVVLTNIDASRAGLPPDWSPINAVHDARDLFIGYLLLDAWIGNTDRHHENWGIIEHISMPPQHSRVRYLAPTFDHASSLGCHLLDAERTERLTTKDRGRTVEAYAAKARSALYLHEEDHKPLKPIDAFLIAARTRPGAGQAWLQKLSEIQQGDIDAPFDRLPTDSITTPSRDFARQMLSVNRARLLLLRKELV